MSPSGQERTLYKESLQDSVNRPERSALRRYQSFFVGQPGLGALLGYELAVGILAPLPGALGLFLRRIFYSRLFRQVGSGVVWGRNIAIRHPGSITIGNRVGIDDGCLLDARGSGKEGISIGDDVIIARDTIIQAKVSGIRIGSRCTISSQCQLSSSGGIELGQAVMVGGQCYVGGGLYRTDDRSIPMRDQALYTRGPVIIEDDVWIGAGVTILDGVRIGTGSVVGAGAVVREDLPAFSIATPYQKLVLLPRGEQS